MNNKPVKIKVSPSAWGESENAWFILSIQGNNSWCIGYWYPKKICSYDKGIITAPKWFYDRMFGHLEKKPQLIE